MIAFFTPIFLVLSLERMKKLSIFSSFFLFLLNFKRITAISLIFVKTGSLKIFQRLRNRIIYVSCFLSIALFFALGDLNLQKKISDLIGVSIGLLTMGRSTYFSIILEGIHLNFVKIIFGSGMGIPQELIYESIGKRFLLHNDWIKLFIEGGLISISVAILHLNKLTIIPKIFICIWMMTDNVIVYFPVILLLDWYEYQRKNIII